MFGGSSQLPTTAKRTVNICLEIVEHKSDNIVGSWEELPNIRLTAAKNAFVGCALNFRDRMSLKGALMGFEMYSSISS